MDYCDVQAPECSPEQMYSPPDAKACCYPPQYADDQAAENGRAPALQEALKNAVLTPVADPSEDASGDPGDGETGTQDPVDGDGDTTEEETTSAIPGGTKKRRLLPLILAAAAACLVLAVGIIGFVYHDSYEDAYALAKDGSYAEARDTLRLPFITELHDPELLQYIDAGILLRQGDYDGARLLLGSLVPQDYLSSADLVLEANYLDAQERLLREDYTGAQALLEPLSRAGYRDADALLLSIDYAQGSRALAQGDLQTALRYLEPLARQDYADSGELYHQAKLAYAWDQVEDAEDLSSVEDGLASMTELAEAGYGPAHSALEEAYALIYDYGVELYHSGSVDPALPYFQLLGDHARSRDYRTLIQAHDLQTSLEDLWALRGFADADALLLSEYYLCQFLDGSWSGGSYYCDMEFEGDGSSFSYTLSYNLPWQYSGSCEIEEGIMMIYHNGGAAAYNEFRFAIDSWDQITIYCYKDGSSHTLYRE